MLLDQEKRLFKSISHSHLYWGRKPITGLSRILEGLRPGDIFLDPFCGGGTSIVTALSKGARVIASDLNPMAVFLSKVLIQPVSLFALRESFEVVRKDVAGSILKNYTISCPKCGKEIPFDYLKWIIQNGEAIPEAIKVSCNYCGLRELRELSRTKIGRQLKLSAMQPRRWSPKTRIRSQRKTKVEFFHELLTGRNLTSLSELWHAIEQIPSATCKDVLKYVFTAMLYSCSSMQMVSDKWPSSSRGWTALRFYLPSIRQEKNVWQAFANRFKTVLKAKENVNPICQFVRISDSMEEFESSDDNAFIYQGSFSKSLFPKNVEVQHVLLDPPYNDDIDYLGFSEFWGSWLGMDFDINSGWHPGTISIEENSEKLLRLLMHVKENTVSSCSVTLAYGSKNAMAWEFLSQIISNAGYEVQNKFPIIWDNSQKRGKDPSRDLYLVLGRATKRPKEKSFEPSQEDWNELRFFVRVAAFLLRPDVSNPEGIVDLAVNLVKPYLRIPLRNVDTSSIRLWALDEQINRKAYNRLAFALIKPILSQDGFSIVSANISEFDQSNLKNYEQIGSLPIPKGLAKGADFVSENAEGNRILFCFHRQSDLDALKHLAKRVLDKDKDKFRTICYLIVRTHKEILRCRRDKQSDNWPRGFFIEFNELLKKARDINKSRFGHLSTISPRADSDFRSQKKIEHFNAKVIENFPVGGDGDPKHFMLRFEAPQLEYVVPGQFLMIDTLPYKKRRQDSMGQFFTTLPTPGSYPPIRNTLLESRSFLKRPFSIHRAYYRHFELGYLKNIYLSHTLASITHTVFPHKFEIFYKVTENGTGTNELTKMKKGHSFQTLGPLGKRPNLAKWLSDGIQEVHLIGGGVGMAPLMFFGQALRYYSFRIKAFIGIDTIGSLLFKAPLAETFGEDDPSRAYVYIDNLKSIGLSESDIHISFEKTINDSKIDIGLPKQNYFTGFVSGQYKAFLEKLDSYNGILVLTCGPKPMLRALAKITSAANIQMKVLLEKRMGCGIGVCMSCVCRTKKNGEERYSRVCTEGPLFDSQDIVWEKL